MSDYKSRLKNSARKEKERLPQTLIPLNATLVRTLGEHARENNYRLNFKYYNHSQCQLSTVSNFRLLIDKFNYMTISNFVTFRSRGRVSNSGDYSSLYRGLPDDADLEEIECGASPGRIMFFRIVNYICLVAVLTTHRRI